MRMKNVPHRSNSGRILTQSLIVLSTLAMVGQAFAHLSGSGLQDMDSIPHKLRTGLHQEIEIHASPQRVYDALLSSKQFTAFTGMAATISTKADGEFSMFQGQIKGRNIELVPGQRIVQAWRPGSWKPGVFSIVKFELKPKGDKTLVILDHTGFPEGDYDSLNGGWTGHYWDPMKKFFP